MGFAAELGARRKGAQKAWHMPKICCCLLYVWGLWETSSFIDQLIHLIRGLFSPHFLYVHSFKYLGARKKLPQWDADHPFLTRSNPLTQFQTKVQWKTQKTKVQSVVKYGIPCLDKDKLCAHTTRCVICIKCKLLLPWHAALAVVKAQQSPGWLEMPRWKWYTTRLPFPQPGSTCGPKKGAHLLLGFVLLDMPWMAKQAFTKWL